MQSMVKCLICGAVFSAEETVCPVCGAGPEQFVPVAPENVSFRRDTQEIFLVLGGGTAAFSAAEAIRERNATCSIVLVTDEDTPPYARPMLTKSFGAAEETLYLREPAWFERQRILLLTGRRVERLDPNAQEVWLDGGARLHYDRCVYALGAECFIPPIPGASMPGAVAIRRLRDIRAIRRRLDGGAQRAVVIGGGVLGLEAAWALRQQGCRVTVLEASERAMMRQLDEESSAMLMDIARQAGVEILCRAQSERILGTEHVEGVRLQSGEELPADLVVLSCGVRANLAVAQAAGCENGTRRGSGRAHAHHPARRFRLRRLRAVRGHEQHDMARSHGDGPHSGRQRRGRSAAVPPRFPGHYLPGHGHVPLRRRRHRPHRRPHLSR